MSALALGRRIEDEPPLIKHKFAGRPVIPSDEDRIHGIIDCLSPSLGQEPYGSSAFERISPIGEETRSKLVLNMLSLREGKGHELFIKSANLWQISRDAATHRALETMYTGPVPEKDYMFLWARLFMENIHNAMAVRNRLRIVKQEFGCFMGSPSESVGALNVLSVAAGSSRGLLEETATLPSQIRDRMHLKLIDVAPEAGEDARNLARELRISDLVETITGNVIKVNGYLKEGYKAHFVEVVGLLDYLEDKTVVNLLRRLKGYLYEGGMILFSNIVPNDERDFTERIVGWEEMKYRSAEELAGLAKQADFLGSTIKVIRGEPLGIYTLVSATN